MVAVVWVTVTLVDVAVVSPEEVAWTLRVPAMVILHVKVATPELAFLVSVAPADGQPSEVAETVTLAELVVARFPSVSSTRTVTVWVLPATHGVVGSGVKASLTPVVWLTVTVVDVAVVRPEEVAWTLRVPAVVILQEKVATPEPAFLVSVAPADGQPSEVADKVTLAELFVTRLP